MPHPINHIQGLQMNLQTLKIRGFETRLPKAKAALDR
jgi:hypothetical protein